MYLILCLLTIMNGYSFKRVASIPRDVSFYHHVIGDMNHNGLDELCLYAPHIYGWEIWEYKGWNLYQKVYTYQPAQDTSCKLYDTKDCDEDGLSDAYCEFFINRRDSEEPFSGIAILEAEDFHSFPSSVVWFDSGVRPVRFTDLDSDGKMEVFGTLHGLGAFDQTGVVIYESQGNNNYRKVFLMHYIHKYENANYIFGDFDRDGKKSWMRIVPEWEVNEDTNVCIWESIDDNEYKKVWADYHRWINVGDAWLGNDTDGDGKPEIFVKSRWFGGPAGFALSMYEATGDNTYKLIPIDTIWRDVGFSSGKSCCGDVDGDGREEVIVSLGAFVIIYKAVGDNRYEKVWEWENDIGSPYSIKTAITACHDFNKNGYDEIIISGNGRTSIFEIDTTYGIASKPKTPKSYNLSISPNPVKGMVHIRYEIPVREAINLSIYDASGRLVRILARAQSQEPRVYSIKWDGKDEEGEILPSGVYFIRLEAKGITRIEKVILMR